MHQAAALYKESLTIAEEHLENFRLDPLMNLHVHHNLAQIYRDSVLSVERLQESEKQCILYGISSVEFDSVENDKQYKRSKENQDEVTMPPRLIIQKLEEECENVKQKFLFAFCSKLSTAQQDFRNLYSQVSSLC